MAAPNNPAIPPNPQIPYVNCERRTGPTARSPDCGICLQAIEANDPVIVHLNCENAWHTECLDSWVRTVGPSHCPICRLDHKAIAPTVPPAVIGPTVFMPRPEALPPALHHNPTRVELALQMMIAARIVDVEREITILMEHLQVAVNEHRRFRLQLDRDGIDRALRERRLEHLWSLSQDIGRLCEVIRQWCLEVDGLRLEIGPGPQIGAGLPRAPPPVG